MVHKHAPLIKALMIILAVLGATFIPLAFILNTVALIVVSLFFYIIVFIMAITWNWWAF